MNGDKKLRGAVVNSKLREAELCATIKKLRVELREKEEEIATLQKKVSEQKKRLMAMPDCSQCGILG